MMKKTSFSFAILFLIATMVFSPVSAYAGYTAHIKATSSQGGLAEGWIDVNSIGGGMYQLSNFRYNIAKPGGIPGTGSSYIILKKDGRKASSDPGNTLAEASALKGQIGYNTVPGTWYVDSNAEFYCTVSGFVLLRGIPLPFESYDYAYIY